MALNNPAYSRNEAFSDKPQGSAQVSAAQLEQMYNQPAAYDPQAPVNDRMTIDDTLMKSFAAFGLLLVGAIVGWMTVDSMPYLWIGAALVGFVLAMVNIFKREPSPVLILAYALAQGVFLGGISAYYEAAYPGIVVQASVATLVRGRRDAGAVRQRQDPRVGQGHQGLHDRDDLLPGVLAGQPRGS